MNPKLERRQCVKCHDYFTVLKLHRQDICYNCENEEDGLRCPCCGYLLRTKPHNKEYKDKLVVGWNRI